jgi:arylformamidase
VNEKLHMSEPEAQRLSPLFWSPPAGRILDAVVGGNESGEYLRQSRTIAESWGLAGVRTRYDAIPGANHFTAVAPLADPSSTMTLRMVELVRTA